MSFDVLIIGASVAGNSAALECARAGLKVKVIERSDPKAGYRIKPCGGGLSPITLEEFPETKEFVVHQTHEIVSVYNGLELITKNIEVNMANRDELDLGLAEIAQSEGAEYEFGKSWSPKSNDEDYEWLIGAAGINCPVAKDFYSKNRVPAKVAYFDDPKWNERDQIEIHLFDELLGYAWVFPKSNFVDVGVAGETANLNQMMKKYCKIHGYSKPSWSMGWAIPLGWDPKNPPRKDNILLVGDSGSFVNPMTGEGILLAMRSGREAAQVCAGKLPAENYPTFNKQMMKLTYTKEKIDEMGPGGFFELGLQNKEVFDEMIEFIYLEKPAPRLPQRSDLEKQEIYAKMLNNLQQM